MRKISIFNITDYIKNMDETINIFFLCFSAYMVTESCKNIKNILNEQETKYLNIRDFSTQTEIECITTRKWSTQTDPDINDSFVFTESIKLEPNYVDLF